MPFKIDSLHAVKAWMLFSSVGYFSKSFFSKDFNSGMPSEPQTVCIRRSDVLLGLTMVIHRQH